MKQIDYKNIIQISDFINCAPNKYIKSIINDWLLIQDLDVYKNIDKKEYFNILNCYIKSLKNDECFTPEEIKTLYSQWVDSNYNDYSVYDNLYYIFDIWASWFYYSRPRLKNILKYYELKNNNLLLERNKIKTVLDLGSELGLSSIALSHIYPNAKVYWRPLQFRDNKTFEFTHQIVENFDNILYEPFVENVDIMFANEYFEHYEKPIEHLSYILNQYNPSVIFIHNIFHCDKTIGHFSKYKINNKSTDSKTMKKEFNKYLKIQGYKEHRLFWNNTPSVWIKE